MWVCVAEGVSGVGGEGQEEEEQRWDRSAANSGTVISWRAPNKAKRTNPQRVSRLRRISSQKISKYNIIIRRYDTYMS